MRFTLKADNHHTSLSHSKPSQHVFAFNFAQEFVVEGKRVRGVLLDSLCSRPIGIGSPGMDKWLRGWLRFDRVFVLFKKQ
jgi:hypothetical protein